VYKRGEGGYTLLETLLAVTVTILVLSAALRLLSFTSAAAARAVVRGELTESARTSADVMRTNIQRASELKLTADANNTLKRLELTEPGQASSYIFTYDPAAPPAASGYHRLIFSGDGGYNELASNIACIRILSDNPDTLIIEILTDNTVTTSADSANKRADITVDPVLIRIPVNVAGKTVTIIN